MTNHLHSPLKNQREEKQNFLTEVSQKEKHLLTLIHTKGLLQTDVKELYRSIRSDYERIIMYENEQSELQDLEYCLWKLHYKHIDEFRKKTKCSASGSDRTAREFKLFLSEATEFYQNLIAKIRKCYRLPDESSFYRRDDDDFGFSEPKKIKQCHFLCHRFLVCLGDLARYREQYEKPDARTHDWSMAATYYMEATAIWPDSGNPQNQLAVLATYIGDEFLALYHCIRSLAVKEPFPDAKDNLIVLLERNRSSFPQSQSTEARFDFSKPWERSKSESTCSLETDVWSHFIRLISFFFLKSSFDDFPSAFASIMRELDTLMALDDTALKASLESYKQMDSVKTGPFRALQAVSVFLYALQVKDSDGEDTKPRLWTAAFVFVARFVDRCLTAGSVGSCPLLPAVLVFVEWLANGSGEPETNGIAAAPYFFGSLADLVKRLGAGGSDSGSTIPLWEDYELRGFVPVSRRHESLDFSSGRDFVDSFEKGADCRARRIVAAGRSFVNLTPRGEDEEVILFSPFAPVPAPPAVSAGPPSLNAWVAKEKKHCLSAVTDDPPATQIYASPLPSAPLLPDDAAWYQSWTDYVPVPVPVAIPPPAPVQRQMTSSEWLRQYLQAHHGNLQGVGAPAAPWQWGGASVQVESPAAVYTAVPVEYGAEKGWWGWERGVAELQGRPLLEYLKERERQLQGGGNDPAAAAAAAALLTVRMMRGPTYM